MGDRSGKRRQWYQGRKIENAKGKVGFEWRCSVIGFGDPVQKEGVRKQMWCDARYVVPQVGYQELIP